MSRSTEVLGSRVPLPRCQLTAHAACAALLVGAALTLVMAGVHGCGRKADPRPPELTVPQAPTDLKAEIQPGDAGIKVSWKRPKTYVDGSPLDDLGSFVVLRSCGEQLDFRQVAVVPVEDRDRFRRAPTFSITDREAPPSEAPSGSSCRYRVIATTLDGYRSAPLDGVATLRK